MAVKIFSYNFASELTGIIRGLEKNKNIRFVIPSKKDKNFFPDFDAWTWNEIYDDINRAGNSQKKRVISPPDHLLILRAILSEALSEFPEKSKALPGIERPGFLGIISADIRELLNEAVKPERLIHNPESDNPSEFLLPVVYSRYIKYLSQNNLIDSAQICTAAYDELVINQSWGKNFVIVFVGFMSFNGSQMELLKGIRDRCRDVIIIKPEANLKNFHDVNEQIFSDEFTQKKSRGHVIEIPTSEPGLEPEIIARTLALWKAGNFKSLGNFASFDDVGISISAGREEAFCEAFSRYGVPYDLTAGIPISQTMPGKILASIRNLYTRRFPTYDTAILLTQSCFAGVNFPVMKAYRAGCSGLDGWEKFLSDKEEKYFSDALTAIKAIKNFCGKISKKTPAKIIKAFHDFLTTKNLWLSQDDKISLFPELDEAIRQTASAIQTVGQKVTALDELITDLGKVLDEHFSTDEAFEFLEDWCRKTNTRAPLQLTNSVRVFTDAPPVLASFPIWIMTGITQKTWTQNMTSSPLLGNIERENLHIPAQREKAEQREALFRRLLHTGEKITIISRPQLDDEGRPVGESQFVPRFFQDLPDWTREILKPEGINIFLGSDGYIFPQIDATEKISRKVPRIIKKANAVGASDIHELLECPFLWWQKRIAKIYEEESEIFSFAEWGNLLHEYWRRVWTRYREYDNAPGFVFMSAANDEWKILEACEIDDYKKFSHLIKDFRLQRRLKGVKFRADRLAKVQAGILDGLHGAGFIHKKILLEEESHLKNNLENIAFLGQCDRIEILSSPDGEEVAFIADYKDSVSEKYEKGMKIDNRAWNFDGRKKFERGLQLSVYAALFKNYRLMGAYILGLEDGKISGTISKEAQSIFDAYKSKKLHEDISARIDEGNYAMQCAVEILKAGEFSPEYNSSMCRYCRVKSLCRKGEFKGEISPDDDDDEI